MTMKIGGTQIDSFTKAYLEAMFWTEEESLSDDATFYSLSGDALLKVIQECSDFQEQNETLLSQAGNDEQNGHDFWLTRNGHGAGFWDRGYPEAIGQALEQAAHGFGECYIEQGDDGLVCVY